MAQVINGFGNQLFQYATARQIAKKTGAVVKLDLTAFGRIDHTWQFQLDCFPCEFEVATLQEVFELADPYLYNSQGFGFTKRLSHNDYVSTTHYLERRATYEAAIQNVPADRYIEGYFQSLDYVRDVRAEMAAEFSNQPGKKGCDRSLKSMHDILYDIQTSNSVAVHVRRGDFSHHAEINKTYGVCPATYYKQAIEVVSEHQSEIKIFLFSNDIDWCKQHLSFTVPVRYVSGEHVPPIDFYLMNSCKHFVIANSTFSWWAAFLGQFPKKIVVCPKDFFSNFQHMFPGFESPDFSVPDWIKL